MMWYYIIGIVIVLVLIFFLIRSLRKKKVATFDGAAMNGTAPAQAPIANVEAVAPKKV